MSKCLRCSYPRGGPRVCRKCHTPARDYVPEASTEGIEALLGLSSDPAPPSSPPPDVLPTPGNTGLVQNHLDAQARDEVQRAVQDREHPNEEQERVFATDGASAAAMAAHRAYDAEPTMEAPAAGLGNPHYARQDARSPSTGDLTGECSAPAAVLELHYEPQAFTPFSVTDTLAPTDADSVTPPAGDASEAATPRTGCANGARPATLPAHSPYGGSRAKQFMHCSASTALLAALPQAEDEDPDYREAGTQAHALAARCLEEDKDPWELVHEYPLIDPIEAGQLQSYVDYVRSLPGRKRFEVGLHVPGVHPLFYGTIDAEAVPVSGAGDLVLEIADLKWGEGVYVDEQRNEQCSYYACLVIMDDPGFFPDAGRVRCTIAQPRMTWAEPIRSWDTTVGELKRWLVEELQPAMFRQPQHLVYSLGEWCQFCPAKLACAPMRQVYDTATSGDPALVPTYTDEQLGQLFSQTPRAKQFIKALEQEVYRRLMDRIDVPRAKLVAKKVDRVFKDGVEDAARAKFGDAAYTAPKLLSPAVMEKLHGGQEFVREWAFKPDAGYTVATDEDKRAAVTPKLGSELFASALTKYLDAPASEAA